MWPDGLNCPLIVIIIYVALWPKSLSSFRPLGRSVLDRCPVPGPHDALQDGPQGPGPCKDSKESTVEAGNVQITNLITPTTGLMFYAT